MQPVEVMQKAIDVAAVAERYLVAGDLDGASVLVDMADMYVAMARELRIGNLRMTRPSSRSGTLTPVYHDTLIRKTVNWDIQEPLPVPEPYTGGRPQPIDDVGPVEAAEAFEGGLTGSGVPLGQEASFPVQEEPSVTLEDGSPAAHQPAPTVIDGGEPWEGDAIGEVPAMPLEDNDR